MQSKKHKLSLQRIGTAAASVIFFWGFGIMLLVVILNIGIGFTDNNADFRSAFVSMTERNESRMLNNYMQLVLHQRYLEEKGEATQDSSVGAEQNLHTYEMHFDPQNTNFRFAVTDPDGRLLLTNDPLYGTDQQLLATNVRTETMLLDSRGYQNQKHFKDPINDFERIVYGDNSQYLDSPNDYQLWYFADLKIDAAYHDGLDVIVYGGEYTDYMFFDNLKEAESFDYEKAYGPHCEWKIAAEAETAQSAVHDESDHSIMVEVKAYTLSNAEKTSQEDYSNAEKTSLEEYYRRKREGQEIYAADEALEKQLMSGLDITIRGERHETGICYVRTYLPEEMPIEDAISNNYAIYAFLFQHSEWAVVLMFALMILTVASAIAMCSVAGQGENGRVQFSRIHTLPYEFFWILPPLSIAASLLLLLYLMNEGTPYRMIAIFCIGMIFCISAFFMLWLYTTAVRTKTGSFLGSFGIIRIFGFLFGLLRNSFFAAAGLLLALAGLLFFNAALLILPRECVAAAVVMDGFALLFAAYCIYSYFELHRHVRQMETGDFSPQTHPVKLRGDFADFDGSLNDINGKVAEIVARQTKAEHLRTELITNVSHDLKTPLTSIVNYVDLLSREPMQSEAAGEYLEVLRRQAAKLKKLTIDLVDASKASTGNLTVELMPMDLGVFLSQLAGEYDEAFAEKGMTLVQNMPKTQVMILADGRQIWRVFDNLLNNVCKYALTGTRVYLDIRQTDDEVTIVLKNVSARPLNISPDELMERFVRGDASRHTEGSGLGLSIAHDLTALQGGTLQLNTDGDLFKAYLSFPIYHPDEADASPDSDGDLIQ